MVAKALGNIARYEGMTGIAEKPVRSPCGTPLLKSPPRVGRDRVRKPERDLHITSA
jgi:hypothetical protein